MPLPIIEDARLETIEEYWLDFSLAGMPGAGWCFPCDSAGHVDETTLQPAGLLSFRMCQQGSDERGRAVISKGVMCQRRTIRHPAIARCHCNARLELASSWLNTCDAGGRDYDGSGAALAPRQHWGEETGEHWAELVAL